MAHAKGEGNLRNHAEGILQVVIELVGFEVAIDKRAAGRKSPAFCGVTL